MNSLDEKLNEAIARIDSLDDFEKVEFVIQYGSSVNGDIMIHRYGKIDDNLAFNILSEHLDDFHEFISLINDVISRNDFAIGRATR